MTTENKENMLIVICPACKEEIEWWRPADRACDKEDSEEEEGHCIGCGLPLLVKADGSAVIGMHKRDPMIECDIIIRKLVRADVSESIKREIGHAVAHVVDQGFCDFPELSNMMKEHDLLCPWDGHLHDSPDCRKYAAEYNAKIAPCGCEKDDMTCLFTGMGFTHVEGADSPVNRVGDLFGCKIHKKLAIFGIPDAADERLEANAYFHGPLCDGPNGFRRTGPGEVILSDTAKNKIAPYWEVEETDDHS
jgi:hypothetical protein